jgi:hypothetical protein
LSGAVWNPTAMPLPRRRGILRAMATIILTMGMITNNWPARQPACGFYNVG